MLCPNCNNFRPVNSELCPRCNALSPLAGESGGALGAGHGSAGISNRFSCEHAAAIIVTGTLSTTTGRDDAAIADDDVSQSSDYSDGGRWWSINSRASIYGTGCTHSSHVY